MCARFFHIWTCKNINNKSTPRENFFVLTRHFRCFIAVEQCNRSLFLGRILSWDAPGSVKRFGSVRLTIRFSTWIALKFTDNFQNRFRRFSYFESQPIHTNPSQTVRPQFYLQSANFTIFHQPTCTVHSINILVNTYVKWLVIHSKGNAL